MVGEAGKCIPEEIREQYPSLPLGEMAGMRDKLIHAYFGVNRAIIWTTINNDIPPLRSAIQALRGDLIAKETRDGSSSGSRDM
ncbi:hypothetical protein ASZ90_011312 [hydrocarbon metagenome]|uniref:DUF86 domain-containing protein n=1 Tax=hydrocarbon metagenome TaxID=938273 RepID=A0A0W8FDK6_9ZZZZ